MKNLKNVMSVITLALVMLVSVNVSAQNRKTEPVVLDSGNSTQLEIPKEIKSNISDVKSSEVETHMKYSKKYNGYVIITLDKQNKLVNVSVPNSLNQKIQAGKAAAGPVLDCYKDCMSASGGGGSESSPWLCYYMCITGI